MVEGTNFFRGLALIDLAEAMLKRAFGRNAVAVRVNAAGQGDFFQVHVDTQRASVHDVKEFVRKAFYQRFGLAPEQEFVEPTLLPVPARVTDVRVKPRTRSMHRYDIEVEGTHNYLADGVVVHNSPETTTGGKALKFYASVRLDIRRIETLKDGSDMVGNRTRVKVVKNKVAPPFKQAEFDILYGVGISREGSLVDVGVEQGLVRKSGAWYTYEGDQLGQGKENARKFLRDNPDVANEIEKRIKEKLGIGPRVDAPAVGGDVVLPRPIDG